MGSKTGRPRSSGPHKSVQQRKARPSPSRPSPSRPPVSVGEREISDGVRLQKWLANAGIASRRKAEILIRAGRVSINGTSAILGQRVKPSDEIRVDESRIQSDPQKRYIMLNKPAGVVTTASDPGGRKTVLDLIGEDTRLFSVGRLDIGTEGLILLTNDGELTNRLTHPSFEVIKTYVAEVDGAVGRATIRSFRSGIDVGAGRPAVADDVRVIDLRKGPNARSVVEVRLHEGRKHVVRLMFETSGHRVVRLVRTGLGPLGLGRLASGTYRALKPQEVSALYLEAGL